MRIGGRPIPRSLVPSLQIKPGPCSPVLGGGAGRATVHERRAPCLCVLSNPMLFQTIIMKEVTRHMMIFITTPVVESTYRHTKKGMHLACQKLPWSSVNCLLVRAQKWLNFQHRYKRTVQGLHYRRYNIYQWALVTIIGWKSVKNRQNRSVKELKFKKTKIDNLSSIIDANRTIYRFAYWKYVLAMEKI